LRRVEAPGYGLRAMKLRSSITIAPWLILASAFACGGTSPSTKDAGLDAGDAGPDAGDAGFDAGLFAVQLQVAAASQPLYSISFDEQGPFLLALFVASPTQLSCQGLSELVSQGPSSNWLLELWVPNAPGTYAVGPSNSDSYPPSSGAAVAVLLRSSSESSGRVELLPTEGQVVVTSAPSDEAAQTGGAHMKGSFHIGFPADPLQPPQECMSGGEYLPDGGMVVEPTTCICDDWSGNQVSVCDGGGASCCLSTGPAAVFADATFDALPCFVVCIAPDYSECAPLFPDGGGIFPDGGGD